MGEKKSSAKLNKHFAALGAAAAAVTGVGVAEQADAAIVYSGTVNIPIPATVAGVYLNMVTGLTGTSSTLAGWDINPWRTSTNSGEWRVLSNANSTNPDGGVVGTTAAMTNLSLGSLVGPASTFVQASSNATAQFNGLTGFGGVQLFHETTGQIHYGWVRYTFTAAPVAASSTGAFIVDYAYEDTPGVGIEVGAGIPEPASLGLLAAGALGLAVRRNRK